MRTVRTVLAVFLAVSLAACGNFSNLELEDLAFLDALPSASDLALLSPVEDSVEQGLTGDGTDRLEQGLARMCTVKPGEDPFCLGHTMVKNVNVLTFFLLTILDQVRQLPPTLRRDSSRVWGPHEDEEKPGQRWRVEVRRSEVGDQRAFAWKIQLSPPQDPEFYDIVSGSFVPGPGGTSKGAGWLQWDVLLARAKGLSDDRDDWVQGFEIRYDLTAEPKHVEASVVGASGTLELANDRASDGSGSWAFDLPVDIAEDGVADRLEARARWAADRTGRVDAHVTINGGAVPPGPWSVTECWGADLMQTYFYAQWCANDARQPECNQGDAASCAFPSMF